MESRLKKTELSLEGQLELVCTCVCRIDTCVGSINV
jgi:hypothetical protein